ncbi:SRR1-like domain [Dillenia turbinata]|uniref:SRR1-like domain n=1 Tax=Dillenia turbinata TaxID=194707 RepID=A0AAN8UHD6_9MAGN
MPYSDWKSTESTRCKIKKFNAAAAADFVGNSSNKVKRKKMKTDTSTSDEVKRLKKEISITISSMKETRYYGKLRHQLRNTPSFQKEIKRVLGPHQHMTMVIYALGSPHFCHICQYQLAMALLLKHDFSDWIGEVEVYDPMFSPADCEVLKEFGCNVLSVNEHGQRQVKRPTLFFMPHAEKDLRASLLEANWCTSQINRMVLLSSTFDTRNPPKLPRGKVYREGKVYYDMYEVLTDALVKYTTEFEIDIPYLILQRHSFHFFNMDPNLDMDTLLPDDFTREMRLEKRREYYQMDKERNDYKHLIKMCEENFAEIFKAENGENWFEMCSEDRVPRSILCSWHTPARGWIKLNFSGISPDENGSAGFGGVIRNEHNHRLVTYKGSLYQADSIVANAEALRQGLRCLKYISPIKKLVIEGDDLSVIRWASKGPEPPEKITEALCEIFGLLQGIQIVIYYVYEEANMLARKLAIKGAKSRDLQVWVPPS